MVIDSTIKQMAWLHQLKEISKVEIQIAYNKRNRLTHWTPLSRVIENPVDYRTVLQTEVFYDIDEVKWIHNVDLFLKINKVAETYDIPLYSFPTGGKGIHTSFFFNFIIENFPKIHKAKELSMSFKHFRMYLWHKILDLAGIPRDLRGRTRKESPKPLDMSVVDWNDRSKGHMVRVCGGRKTQYDERADHLSIKGHKTLMTEIPTLDENRKICHDPEKVVFPTEVKIWTPPSDWISECIDQFIEKNKDKPSLVENMYNGLYFNLPCVQEGMKGVNAGMRNNTAQIISIAMGKDKYSLEEIKKTLMTFKDRCGTQAGNPFTEYEIYGWATWAYHDVSFWNCKLSRSLGLCDTENCDLYHTQNPEVLELYNNGHILKYIRELLDEEIVGEDQTKLLAFFILLSHISPELAQWAIVSGESSGGKSWVVLKTLKYFPEDRVKKASRRTAASLEHGDDDLRYKILVDLEARGSSQAHSSLLTLNSEGELILETTVKDPRTNDFVVVRKKVQGPPAYITCNASEEIHAEMSTRTWNFGIDQSPEQTEKILKDYFKKKVSLYNLDSRIKSREKTKRTVQEFIRYLKPYPVWIPYLLAFKGYINTEAIRVRRDKDKFTSIIELSALLHQANRSFIEIDGEKVLVAAIDDLIIALELTEKAFKTTSLGVNKPALGMLDLIKKYTEDEDKGLSTREISELPDCNVGQSTVGKYCKELYKAGLVSITSGNRKKGFKYKYSQRVSSDFLKVRKNGLRAESVLIDLKTINKAISKLGLSTEEELQKDMKIFFSYQVSVVCHY